MKVLVTGGAGFIGSWVVRALLDQRHQVVAALRPGKQLATDLRDDARVTVWPVDLDDPAAVEDLARGCGAAVAIHMAWYAEPATYLHSPRNLDSLATAVRLARALYEHGCQKFVGAGSCAEYAPTERLRCEQDPTGPGSLYGVCKLSACAAIQALAAQEKMQFAWARIFHLHGPGDAMGRLVPQVATKLRRLEVVELSDGSQVRDHLHVADVGSGLAVLATNEAASGIVNVCSGQPVTLRRVVESVAEIVGGRDLLRFGARPHRAGEIMHLAGDAARLHSFGWTPRFSLEEGLRDAVEAERSMDPDPRQ